MNRTDRWRAARGGPKGMLWGGLALAGLTALASAQPEVAPVLEEGTELVEGAVEAVAEVSALDMTLLTANNAWMLVATCLVFIMHLGFASLESGLTRAKNTVNILAKNTFIIACGLLTYYVCGFNLMYPGDFSIDLFGGGFFGFAGFGISNDTSGFDPNYADLGYTYHTDFIFQGMFAATAATIVSGAVAERIKLIPFFIFSVIFVALAYPFFGSWKWGEGWLHDLGFYDFAGSTLVHSVGGWGALAGVIVLGPRLGKYVNHNGASKVRPIMGHSMPLAAIGVFLLWFGWFGFNGGSVLSADPELVGIVFTTTSLAAAAGIIGAMLMSWIFNKQPDLSMMLNGALAGLVGITAGADVINVFDSIIVGFIAGVIVYVSVVGFDKLRIDDPVGAISVHLVCGIWGTLAVGIFGNFDDPEIGTFMDQLVGVLACAAFCFPVALVLFLALKFSLGLRVSREEELGGLDIGEHGMEAYGGFQVFPDQ